MCLAFTYLLSRNSLIEWLPQGITQNKEDQKSHIHRSFLSRKIVIMQLTNFPKKPQVTGGLGGGVNSFRQASSIIKLPFFFYLSLCRKWSKMESQQVREYPMKSIQLLWFNLKKLQKWPKNQPNQRKNPYVFSLTFPYFFKFFLWCFAGTNLWITRRNVPDTNQKVIFMKMTVNTTNKKDLTTHRNFCCCIYYMSHNSICSAWWL